VCPAKSVFRPQSFRHARSNRENTTLFCYNTRCDANLHGDGGLRAEHHLHAANVALRAIGHEDLVGLDDGVAIKGARNCLPQVLTPRLRAVPVALYLSQMCICVLSCHHFVNEHADDVGVQALVVASRKPSRPTLEPYFLSSG